MLTLITLEPVCRFAAPFGQNSKIGSGFAAENRFHMANNCRRWAESAVTLNENIE